MSSNTALILATTLLSLQTNLAITQGLEKTAVMVDPIPMTAEQRVEKGRVYFEEGYGYFYGISKPVNRRLAYAYFIQAEQLGNADAKFFSAVSQYENGNNFVAYEFAKEAIALGYEQAQNYAWRNSTK